AHAWVGDVHKAVRAIAPFSHDRACELDLFWRWHELHDLLTCLIERVVERVVVEVSHSYPCDACEDHHREDHADDQVDRQPPENCA
ncbi:MAG: hypothetical protein ACD_66C00014G0002, partial [uncultured bacterium]